MSIRARLCMALAPLLLALPALSQDKIVPIEGEPKHVLKFQNGHVRFFDVELPPGYQSLWHTHLHDGVFVNIETAETVAQDLGAEPARRPPREVGETYFIDYASKPKAHRVANAGATPYRVTDTEIHSGCGRFATLKDHEGQSVIVDNDRVRVTRVVIPPGGRLPLHATCGLLVAVTGARLAFDNGGPVERMDARPADFKWRDSFRPVLLVNEGETVFQGVDIVVK
jgi:hypothetical protein